MGKFSFYVERTAKAIQRQIVLVEADTIDEARSIIEDEAEINAPIEDDSCIEVIEEKTILTDYEVSNKEIKSLDD